MVDHLRNLELLEQRFVERRRALVGELLGDPSPVMPDKTLVTRFHETLQLLDWMRQAREQELSLVKRK
jgi:hypothetical protein